MHGGAPGSGAPPGNKNALKHGQYTRDARPRNSSASTSTTACWVRGNLVLPRMPRIFGQNERFEMRPAF